jgi:uracil-DNA glycosylase family 4
MTGRQEGLMSSPSTPYYHHGLIYQPDCHLCPLRKLKKVPPDGPIPAKIVFCAESPGRNEIEQGRSLIGPSGKLLWLMCEQAGLPPREEAIWVTNAALCAPQPISLTTGGRLGVDQVKEMATKACRRRLLWEIWHVTQGNPDAVVVPIGKWALWAVSGFPKPKILRYRGSVNQVDFEKILHEGSKM